MDNEKNVGYIVTHTHWDREWQYLLWEKFKEVRNERA